MKWLHIVAFLLVWIGALNLGLVALLNLNVVQSVLGVGSLDKWFNVLVGLGAVYTIYGHFVQKDCKVCSK